MSEMQSNDGGPAFPIVAGGAVDDGMTLRDYFAAKAMVARMLVVSSGEFTDDFDDISVAAYLQADAMLAERAKGGAA